MKLQRVPVRCDQQRHIRGLPSLTGVCATSSRTPRSDWPTCWPATTAGTPPSSRSRRRYETSSGASLPRPSVTFCTPAISRPQALPAGLRGRADSFNSGSLGATALALFFVLTSAGPADHLKVGDGCVGEAAEPADVVTILRGRRRRCKGGAPDSGPLCDLTTRHARFGGRGREAARSFRTLCIHG